MQAYKDIVENVLKNGKLKKNRTGIDTLSITGALFEHDMSTGYPLLTSKKMAYKSIFSELEFFIKGYHDKQWLKDRKNTIWNEWCSPCLVDTDLSSEKINECMLKTNELGPIYGVQWRHFNAPYYFYDSKMKIDDNDNMTQYRDQLKSIVNLIKCEPTSRRMICSAWNPLQLKDMALPPCHVLWQVLIDVNTKTMDLIWYQRSVDTMLGLPFNIASYALLLELLCKESGIYTPGKLVGMLADVHIYENHIDNAKIQLERPIHKLPTLTIDNFTSIFDFDYTTISVNDYIHEDKLLFPIAV